jgi:predicted MFS family arabinose efflux permease
MARMSDSASSDDHTTMQNRQKSGAQRELQVEQARTRWFRVWTIICAGVVAALHIGKAPIAVPLLRDDLGLSLAFASWIIGAYAAVGAVGGLPAGMIISHVGARRSLAIGLLVIGAASCAGALATSGPVLLVTRVVEGAGFLMVAIAAPMLLRMLTAPRDRDAVFGWWAIYFTIGSVIGMLAGPLVARFGWQTLWYITGLLSLAYAAVAWLAAPQVPKAASESESVLRDLNAIVRAGGPILVALAFGLYSFQYHALTGLLPSLLMERLQVSIAAAGAIGAASIVASGVGAVTAGFLLRQGVALWAIIAAAFSFMGLVTFGIFHSGMPLVGVTALGIASLGATGFVPASIYAAAPRFAPEPTMLALTVGCVVQASHLGHVLGPAALGLLAEHFGWSAAPALFVAIACGGVAVALKIRRLLRAR